jgi:ATP-dependent Clp protease ATP-binding subunit ClpA
MAVKAAISEAERRNDSHVGTEHLLLGVAAVSSASSRRAVDLSVAKLRAGLDSLDESALSSVGIDMGAVEDMSYDLSYAGRRHRLFTGGGKQVLRDALGLAVDAGHRRIGPEHILLAISRRPAHDVSYRLLRHVGVCPESLGVDLERAMRKSA